MWTSKTIFLVSLFVGACLLSGCMDGNQPFDAALKPSTETGQRTSQVTAKQFQDTSSDGPTAVESAIELSKKYAALSEETTAMKLENQSLTAKNRQLVQQTAVMEQELAQAKKELSEANDLLIEMRIELNNWKADVLGFREEMRETSKVQLETLMKILKVLGGDVPGN